MPPQELMKVEARHIDLVNNRWVFKVRESKGKKRVRTVYLTEKAAEITRRLAQEYPAGKLFRNEDGEPWLSVTVSEGTTISARWGPGRNSCVSVKWSPFRSPRLFSPESP